MRQKLVTATGLVLALMVTAPIFAAGQEKARPESIIECLDDLSDLANRDIRKVISPGKPGTTPWQPGGARPYPRPQPRPNPGGGNYAPMERFEKIVNEELLWRDERSRCYVGDDLELRLKVFELGKSWRLKESDKVFSLIDNIRTEVTQDRD